jgi:DNA-binding protein HU-beta
VRCTPGVRRVELQRYRAYRAHMNKTQLVDALAERLGDRRTAAAAVDGLLETIVDSVRAGESVSLTGFGVFEGRARAARTARNPRTGDAVDVPATTVPAFRPGTSFRNAVADGAAPAPGSAVDTGAPKVKKAASDASFSAPSGKAGGTADVEAGVEAAAEPAGEADKAASGKNGKNGKDGKDGKKSKAGKNGKDAKSAKASDQDKKSKKAKAKGKK